MICTTITVANQCCCGPGMETQRNNIHMRDLSQEWQSIDSVTLLLLMAMGAEDVLYFLFFYFNNNKSRMAIPSVVATML